MKTTHSTNQLFTDPQADRMTELRVWMLRRKLTYVEIGRRMGGLTSGGVLRLVQGDRMPVERHQQMLALGIPVELLPVPMDVPAGRPPRALEQPPAA